MNTFISELDLKKRRFVIIHLAYRYVKTIVARFLSPHISIFPFSQLSYVLLWLNA